LHLSITGFFVTDALFIRNKKPAWRALARNCKHTGIHRRIARVELRRQSLRERQPVREDRRS